tara:strand:- start:252 stop:827 length:576 start_codon:yes stop_codon:yes gene_type:complete
LKKIEIISSLLGDVALPLMGFLFWDWGFYFIALFFLFDLIFKTFFLKKRLSALEEMRGRNKFLLYSFLFSLIEVLMIHFIVIGAFPSLNIGDTFIDFLSYEELGIAQGIVLLPLLFLNEWMRVRNENKIAVPHTIRIQIMFNSQRIQVYRLILWLAMGLGVLFLSINELTLIIAFFLFFIAQPFLVFRNVN